MTMKPPTVFIPEPIGRSGLALLRAECRCIAPWESGPVDDQVRREQRKYLDEADAVVVRLFALPAADLHRDLRLRIIAKHGAGVDNIDCEAATRRGIPVTIAAAANALSVAEHTLALLFALARRIPEGDRAVRDGEMVARDRYEGMELSGKTLGVVGVGRIGSRVARLAAGLGMRIVGYDPPLDKASYSGPATFVESLEELCDAADFLTLHVPLTESTTGMVNGRTLAALKRGAYLINTSRGAVVEEPALIAALEDGHLRGAGMDVFAREPVRPDDPICGAPNTILSPHMAGTTAESRDRVSRVTAATVLRVLRGERPEPENLVNPEVYHPKR